MADRLFELSVGTPHELDRSRVVGRQIDARA